VTCARARARQRLFLDAYEVVGPKIDALTDAELGLWVRLLGACARIGGPNVDAEALDEVRGLTTRRLARYVELGLLDAGDGGYVIPGWDGYFPRGPTATARKARQRERAVSRCIHLCTAARSSSC
jgi:hypothetical protein